MLNDRTELETVDPAMEDSIRVYRDEFEQTGYCVARSLFAAGEVEALRRHFAEIRKRGVPGHYEPVPEEQAEDDILKAYPRVMNPHRFSEVARRALINPRVAAILRALFAEEPLAVQSMYYFKPPGSRGQKMHQDQFYLQVRPGTCIAAWTALDYCDRTNGGMILVPLTHEFDIDCRNVGGPGSYDPNGKPIPIPDGYRGECPELAPGDTLFFNGSLIHGSGRNRTTDRWRRSFIGHYVGVSCTTISEAYHPLVTMAGHDVERESTTDGGPCGAWVGAAH